MHPTPEQLGEGDVLGQAEPEAWKNEIEQVLVGGMPKVNETVFLHRASDTLIIADLLFNLGSPGGSTGFCCAWRGRTAIPGLRACFAL